MVITHLKSANSDLRRVRYGYLPVCTYEYMLGPSEIREKMLQI